VQEHLAIPLRSGDAALRLAEDFVPGFAGERRDPVDRRMAQRIVPNDAPLPDAAFPHLELRLDEGERLGAWGKEAREHREDVPQGDEGDVDDRECHLFR